MCFESCFECTIERKHRGVAATLSRRRESLTITIVPEGSVAPVAVKANTTATKAAGTGASVIAYFGQRATVQRVMIG